MSALALSLLLSAVWTDPAGRVRCDVPDSFSALPDQPWRFSRADGLRQLVLLTVKPVPVGPGERAKALLERAGMAELAAAGNTATGKLAASPPASGPALAAAFAVAPTEPTWAGVLLLGPPSAAVSDEATALAATCRKVTPIVASGRIFDTTRRLSAAVPAGHEALEVRGAGAVQAPGYTIRLTAVQPMLKPTLQEVAIEWLKPSGATLTGTSGAAAGKAQLPVVVASGTYVQKGVEYLIEVAAIDFGNGEVGGLGVSASVGSAQRARATLDEMLGTITLEPPPVAPAPPPPPPPPGP